MTGRLQAILAGALLSLACAREAGAPLSAAPAATPRAFDPRATQSRRIPGGPRCLEVLDQLGVRYERLSRKRGVSTPVEIQGDIGGVRYTSGGRPTLVCDCRLALALHWSSQILASFGVSEVEHYGAYSYRTTRSGRPSLHARGLALDAAAFRFGKQRHEVSEHFARGWGSGCFSEAPPLNQLACQLRSLSLFRELITPDHDRDHHDHFHLAIAPL